MTISINGKVAKVAFDMLTPMLGVADVEKSRRFYVEALGFESISNYAPEGRLCWCELVCGEAHLMLTLNPAAGEKKKAAQLYVRIGNASALHESLKSQGYTVSALEDRFYDMREFEITDPDGYTLIFGQDISGHSCCCGAGECAG